MSFQRFLIFLLLAISWGTFPFLPILPSRTAAAQPAKAPLQEAVNVQVADAKKGLKPKSVKSETSHQAQNRRLLLKLRERRVYVYEGDKVLAKYRVAIGKKGWETPTGKFQVIKKVRNPRWKNPWNGKISQSGPNSPLGERWIGFWTDGRQTIGFHGTRGEHLLGRAVSHGCVRMRNRDIKTMFDMVELGTPVVVQP